jgi:PAS domain S-box-containing protein
MPEWNPGEDMSGFSRHLKGAVALAALISLAIGAWFLKTEREELRKDANVTLEAIAQLKVEEVVRWRIERMGDAAVIMESPFFAEATARWLDDPGAERTEEMLAHFRSLQQHYDYRQVLLVDAGGEVRLGISDHRGPLHEEAVQAVAAAVRDRKPMLTDLHVGPGGEEPHLDVVAPLFVRRGEVVVAIGAILLQCDPRRFLYPLIQNWPTPSRTAETLLVRREGQAALFLNELRHRPGTALKLRIPLTQTDVPSVMAVLGQQGVVQGRDYRGVEVLAAFTAVPDSPWFMVAKVDAEEALSVLRRESALVVALLLSLMVTAAAAVGVLWQRNDKAHYRAMFEAEAGRRVSEERYRTILRTAMDGFWMLDLQGRLLEVNEAYCGMSGYHEAELLSMSIADLDATVTAAEIAARIQSAVTQGGARLETRHRRKDGSMFDVEVSAQYQPTEGERLVAFLRDITARKQADDVLTFLAQWQASAGEGFFAALARYLSQRLGMDYVCIDRLEGDRLTARTVAVYFDGKFEDNVSYSLQDTPCGDAVGRNVCCFPSGVRQRFPRDAVLQNMEAESYVGITLWGHTGEPIGLIAVIGRRPLGDPRLALFVLQLVSERATGELERSNAEEALRRSRDELEDRVRERTSELERTNEALRFEIAERMQAEGKLRESETRCRNLAIQLLVAQESERRLIAQDVHDSLGSTLALVKFGVERALREAEKAGLEWLAHPLEGTVSMIRSLIAEVRRIQEALRPPLLDDLGIVATISWYARECRDIWPGISIEQEIQVEEQDVPNPVKTVIFRVLQEALNNVAKHSGADLVRLSLRRTDGTLEFSIQDNGRGFDGNAPRSSRSPTSGMGLASMKERTELSGGAFSIESDVGKGTLIRTVWPLRDDDA